MHKPTIIFLLSIALLAGCSKDPGPDPVDDPRVIILMYHRFLMTMEEALGGGEAFEAYLDEELGGSKRLIEEHIYGSVDALALPYGDGAGDEDIIAAAQRHGYRFIRTSERDAAGNSSSSLFRLPSLPLLDDTDQELIGVYLGI
ncbi:MAG: hypothetical protein P1P83_11150 [Bacteroidales bacterium]|nr:hypothetical protein [Bacteroidales bacterium]MDT8373953.1 hypothetical protein [Bacteroidales bacterium]